MLAADLLRAAERAGHESVALSHAELDIGDADAVRHAVSLSAPEALLNCAAWTDVDGAERAPEAAYAVNADGAGNLARAAATAGAVMVHVSTDYVFGGEARLDPNGRRRPYVESDPPDPRSVYGQSKLAGERQVLEASAGHCVVRGSWLFGVHGANFVDTMLRLGAERESVEVVDDQIGCPTWCGHLGPALIGVLEREVTGLVHLAGGGEVSWNGLAREVFRQAEVECEVLPTTTARMGRPAPRPAYSAIVSEREDVIPLPPWQDGLAGHLAARAGMMRA
jgi:dTDP-4-dehydrorhamnose reductase